MTVSAPVSHESTRRGSQWWTLGVVCLGMFMLLLDVTAVNVALPGIQADLHATLSGLQWVIDAYALTLAACLLTTGSLADTYGRRLMYVIGLVIFTAASALCGFAVSPLTLQLSRGLQGAGGAIMLAVSLALLADAFRAGLRGVALGVWGLVSGLAFAIGPLAGVLLITGISWRWIFFVNIPFGTAAAIITALKVRESRAPQPNRPDWTGFVLFTAALSSLVYGLIEASRESFTDHLVLGCFALAVVLLAAFVTTELVVAHPMFDLALQLLMRGLDAGSTWTHLIPGVITGGVGIGLSTPPLAATAVVSSRRSGPAWPRVSTTRSGRSAWRPASRCLVPCSLARSAPRPAAGPRSPPA